VTEPVVYSGTLSRAEFNALTANLRFHPFVFAVETDLPVLAITCEAPAFDAEALAPLVANDECDIEVSDNVIEIYSYFLGEQRTLSAKAISCSWQPYDIQDYKDQVTLSERSERRTYDELRRVTKRNNEALALIEELARRAEIKSLASEEAKAAQAAVLSALAWVRRKLVADPDEKTS